MKMLKFDNIQAFDELNARIVTYWNENLCPPQGTTDKWTDAKINPINQDVWCVVDDIILPALTQAERESVVVCDGGDEWFEKIGYDTGLGFRLCCGDDDQTVFTKLACSLLFKAASDSYSFAIKDINNQLHNITFSDFKTIMCGSENTMGYIDYCAMCWLYKKQNS